ncbi:YgaT-like protein [Bacillus cereus]|nr:YgaT-like protein [Bacillus cereus]
MITKVITKRNWEIAKINGEINEVSLKEEGFIHCSFLEQALNVAEKHFIHEEDVLLLTIDPTLSESRNKI